MLISAKISVFGRRQCLDVIGIFGPVSIAMTLATVIQTPHRPDVSWCFHKLSLSPARLVLLQLHVDGTEIALK